MQLRRIIIILCVLSLIAIGIFVCFVKLDTKKENTIVRDDHGESIFKRIIKEEFDYGELTEVRYYDESSYLGNTNEYSVTKEDGYKLTRRYNSEAGEPVKVIEYSITEEEFKQLDDLIKEYNLPLWDRFKNSEEEILDGPIKAIVLSYNEEIEGKIRHNSYSVSYDKVYPPKSYDILNDFTLKIESMTNESNIIKEYEEHTV